MRFTAIGMAYAICVVGAPPALANAASPRSAIEARYRTVTQATRHMDVAGVMGVGAPDFKMVIPGQPTMDRGQTEAMLRQQFNAIRKVLTLDTHIDSCRVHGTTAVVVATEKMDCSALNRRGNLERMSSVAKTRDTWVKTPSGWFLQSSHILFERDKVNGKAEYSLGH